MSKLKYYIISHDDAVRIGVTQYRRGTPQDGYVVHSGDFACATEDFLERAVEVTEEEASEFIKSLENG